jgi:hypothetical protein
LSTRPIDTCFLISVFISRVGKDIAAHLMFPWPIVHRSWAYKKIMESFKTE